MRDARGWMTTVGTACLLGSLAACGGGGGGGRVALLGFDFGPYVTGQAPGGGPLSATQIRDRMTLLTGRSGWTWIRTFGQGEGLDAAGGIAHDLGFKAALGAWLSGNAAADEAEIVSVLTRAAAGEADLVIVGSETLRRGDLTPSALAAHLARVRADLDAAGRTEVPVGTADTFDELLAAPEVIAACDVVLPNYYPFWHGIAVENAVAAVNGWHQQMTFSAQGRRVIVSESGWPTAGDAVGSAVPSPANAARYLQELVTWAVARRVDLFVFEAFDEEWKSVEGTQGPHWGMFDAAGVVKPGMDAVLARLPTADTWSAGFVPGGPGTPALELTSVPAIGSTANLVGRAWHAIPSDSRVAVYIRVDGGWWTKPTFSTSQTPIAWDGRWVCDVTTGGADPLATEIAAYLLPASIPPPLASGEAILPASLATDAVASVTVTR